MYQYDPPTRAAENVSAYIFQRLRKLGPVETLKLQKLMYYANAWSLADRESRLFDDPIQAWKHGPVVACLYPYHRGAVALSEWPLGDASQVDADTGKFIDGIVDTYGGLSGWALREMTHREKPWKDAWAGSKEGKILRVPLDDTVTAEYYRSLRSK